MIREDQIHPRKPALSLVRALSRNLMNDPGQAQALTLKSASNRFNG